MRNKERDLGFDENCPKCNSKNIVRETESEYTEREYSVSSEAYVCQDCGNVWRGEESYD